MPAPVVALALAALVALALPSPASAQVEPIPIREPSLTIASPPPPGLDTPELRLDWLEARSAELAARGQRDEALALIERHATPDLLADRVGLRRLVHMTERVEPPEVDHTPLVVGLPLLGVGGVCAIVCTIGAAFAAGSGGDDDSTAVTAVVASSAALAAVGLVLAVIYLVDALRPERQEFLGRRRDLVRRLERAHRHARARD